MAPQHMRLARDKMLVKFVNRLLLAKELRVECSKKEKELEEEEEEEETAVKR